MSYSVFIGILSNFDFGWEAWVFTAVSLLILFVGFSAYLALNKSHFASLDDGNKRKITIMAATFFGVFLLLGVVGLVSLVITYLIMISIISDYRLDASN